MEKIYDKNGETFKLVLSVDELAKAIYDYIAKVKPKYEVLGMSTSKDFKISDIKITVIK
jgi:hypothetical protein